MAVLRRAVNGNLEVIGGRRAAAPAVRGRRGFWARTLPPCAARTAKPPIGPHRRRIVSGSCVARTPTPWTHGFRAWRARAGQGPGGRACGWATGRRTRRPAAEPAADRGTDPANRPRIALLSSPHVEHARHVPRLRRRQARGRRLHARSPRPGARGSAAGRGDDPRRVVQRELQGRPRGARGRAGRPRLPAGPRHRPGRRGRGLRGSGVPGGCPGARKRLRHRHRAPRRLRGAGATARRLGRAHARGPRRARRDGDRDGRLHRRDERGGPREPWPPAGRRTGPGHGRLGRGGLGGGRDPRLARPRGLGGDG